MKKRLTLIPIAIVVIVIVLAITSRQSIDIVVGSKHFTEQKVLGEMIAQLIEANTDLKVRRRLGLQGTKVCFSAIKEGDIDIYPEYTGTGLVNILEKDYHPSMKRENILESVRKEFKNRWNIIWLAPLGFDNTYTLAMRESQAEKLEVEKISDLAPYVAPSGVPHGNELQAGFDHEYTMRPEFKRFQGVYGFSFEGNITLLVPDLMYKAIKDGQVDVIDAFSTDGRIAAYNLRILKDDKNLFPPYDTCILVNSKTLKKHQALKNILEKLSGKISLKQMRRMNYAVTDEYKSPAAVANSFLKEQGLL